MKLHRLRVAHFAGIREADVEFGPGLNVLYGPNDLGKSTLVDAIRLALLLPHTSTSCEQYVGWTGGRDPLVELTFETERQRIWRVKKEFGKSGSSLLQESKNGQDFDDVERARKVDGKLREILRWGIPEPGGSGGARGLPASFLITALLSTQADVTALLHGSLADDPTSSGKEQIAAALQAVAQDPLFVALLHSAQACRDAAYTDKGAKKTAKGSVFKVAADRVKETRGEKERLQRVVTDSEGAEKLLRDLIDTRGQRQEALAAGTERFTILERCAVQAAVRAGAADQIRLARDEVQRIRKTGADVEEAETEVKKLLGKVDEARQALAVAQSEQRQAHAALELAEEVARTEGSDSGVTDTVVRQQLELRKAVAEQAAKGAQQRIDGAMAAKELANATAKAEREFLEQQAKAAGAQESSSQAAAKEQTFNDELRHFDLVERALDLHTADKQVAEAQIVVEKGAALQARLAAVLEERAALAARRGAITVPASGALIPMRRLANDLAAAQGALDVGFVVTVSPKSAIDLRIRKDGGTPEAISTARPLDIEADAEVELEIGDLATVRVRGGRREVQEKARALRDRWNQEVVPQLTAAGVTDLAGLEAKVLEAHELDAAITKKDTELVSFRTQITPLNGAAEALRQASERSAICRTALGDVPLATLSADLAALGADPIGNLRKRRQQVSRNLDTARLSTTGASTAHTLAQERTGNLHLALDEAILKRDAARTSFPEGVDAALAAAQTELNKANVEKQSAATEFASLEGTIAARKKRIDEAMHGARTKAAIAANTVEAAQGKLTVAVATHAAQHGRLIELRKQRDAEDLLASEMRLHEATERHAALAVPEHNVTADEVMAARNAVTALRSDLDAIEREIQRAHGALEQVGGSVARERLRDATEAFELAEQRERETEADCEAWKLLLDQMKAADAAQASNLGQVLGPAIAVRFQALTERRYESLQLNAQLGTEGVLIGGAARPPARLSVGTREQLSTLYRLSLAEYLHSTVVLDDQLVQSDNIRMDWCRALLIEKARSFQIIVFTCRPGDYLAATSMVPAGGDTHADTNDGFIRAIDLGRVLSQRQVNAKANPV